MLHRLRVGIIACVVAGCANNVPQDRATGPDGKVKGARAIVLEQNEGRVRGIVTYPGGDRVDWKQIKLPDGQRGKLDLQMTYTTPRPGLRVAFDVFDQWNTPVELAAVSGGRGRIRSATVNGAKGIYFVRIYAPRRGDAGAYKLVAEFKPEPTIGFNPLDLEILPPPKLPDVPEPPVETATVTPPTPPTPPPTAVTPPATPTPPPPPPAKPITTRMLKFDTVGGGIEVTVPVGATSGVTPEWKVKVLRGQTTSALSGGAGSIVRVDRRTTIVKVSLTPDQLGANPNIVLSP